MKLTKYHTKSQAAFACARVGNLPTILLFSLRLALESNLMHLEGIFDTFKLSSREN